MTQKSQDNIENANNYYKYLLKMYSFQQWRTDGGRGLGVYPPSRSETCRYNYFMELVIRY